ncbi:MAG: hypothetical protein J1E37_05415 [Prevotella sp.]|nr:hypothetical protein [Prevotella sp.]
MKRNRKYNLLGWLAVSMLLMTTACSDHADLEAGALQGDPNGTNTVTFTIQPETQSVGRRAGAENKIKFGDGTKADLLIFAVYEYKNEKWVLAEELKGKNTTDIEDLQLGDKQYALKVEGFPVKFQLTLNSGTKYKVAFWAQNSGCKAYDTHDLQAVEVKYENALNNDELRDAFCTTTEEFDGGTVDKPIEAILRRPLAQINIGTTGWDYEGAAYLKPSPVSYTHSTVTLEGVAQYYNVLDGKAIVDDTDHKTTNVTFGYAKIPAFINVTDEEWKAAEHLYQPFANEEYLKVKLFYEDEDYKEYVGWDKYDQFRKDPSSGFVAGKLPETETFKYLSMCYVLVPEAVSITDINNVNYGSVLDAVKFETKGIDEEDPNKDKESTPKQVFEIKNVPVQKNWRTNILGNSFFVYNNKFIVDIVPDYCGDYNNIGGTENDWQGRTGNEEDGWQYKGNPNTDFDDHDYNDPKGN